MLDITQVMLTGKRALVTGGGAGLGKGIALNLATFGADVAVVDINETSAMSTAQEVRELGRHAVAIQGDVGLTADVERAIAETVRSLGRLDILVNNAGAWKGTPAIWMDEAKFDEDIRVNLKGVFWPSKVAAAMWVRERTPGVIVNISSTEGIRGCPTLAAYSAAKAGIISLTKTLSSELGPYGIRVNAVAPDYSPTESGRARAWSEGHMERVRTAIPLQRLGTPDDTAGAVVFLASGLSSWITGQTIVVDGGSLACARIEGPMPMPSLA